MKFLKDNRKMIVWSLTVVMFMVSFHVYKPLSFAQSEEQSREVSKENQATETARESTEAASTGVTTAEEPQTTESSKAAAQEKTTKEQDTKESTEKATEVQKNTEAEKKIEKTTSTEKKTKTIKGAADYTVDVTQWKLIDSSGNEITAANALGYHESGKFSADFTIEAKNGATFQNGDVIEVSPYVYPDNAQEYKLFLTKPSTPINLTNAAGTVIGTFTVLGSAENAEIYIKLNANAANTNKLTGTFSGLPISNFTEGEGTFLADIAIGNLKKQILIARGKDSTVTTETERIHFTNSVLRKDSTVASGSNTVGWYLEYGEDAISDLYDSQGKSAAPRKGVYLEDELPAGSTIDFSRFKVNAIYGIPVSATDTRSSHVSILGYDDNYSGSFTLLTQKQEETFEQFQARIKSKALQYGDYKRLDGSHVLMIYLGDVPGNGLKYRDDIGDYLQQYWQTYQKRYLPITDEEKAVIQKTLGSGNAISGTIPALRFSFYVTYPRPAVDTELINIGSVRYNTDVYKTADAKCSMDGINGSLARGEKYSVKVFKGDSADSHPLEGAKFKLQHYSGGSWIDYSPVDGGEAVRATNASGIAEFKKLAPGTYRFVETQAAFGYDKDTAYYMPGTFVISDSDTEGAVVAGYNDKLPVYQTVFHMQGHGIQVDTQDVISGQNVQKPEDPVAQGYVFDGWYTDASCSDSKKFNFSAAVTGNLDLYAKWSPGTNTVFRVEHYKETTGGSGTYGLAETEKKSGVTDATVDAAAKGYVKSYTGFKENAAYSKRVASGVIAADGSLVLKLYYDLQKYSYKTEYYQQNIFDEAYTKVEEVAGNGYYGSSVEAPAKEYTGFHEVTSFGPENAAGTVPGNDTLVLKRYFDRDGDVPYKVEHYKETGANTNVYAKVETEQLTGMTGATVAAVPKKYIGYEQNKSYSQSVLTGTIAGDGSLVLRVYYKMQTTVVKAVKEWKGDLTGTVTRRPSYIFAQVYADGQRSGSQIMVRQDQNWTWAAYMPKYNIGGKEIEYTVKETSKVKGYQVSYSSKNNKTIITNTYNGGAILRSGGFAPYVIKSIAGDKPASPATFKFMISAKTVGAPMPGGSQGSDKSVFIKGAGTQNFGVIDFSKEGTFEYLVQEINTRESGYVYDSTVYTMTIRLEKTSRNTYEGMIVYSNGSRTSSYLQFTNTYDQGSSGASLKKQTAASKGKSGQSNSYTGGSTGSTKADGTSPAVAAASGTGSSSGGSSGAAASSTSSSVKTGDQMPVKTMAVLLAAGAAGIAVILWKRKKRKDH